MNYFLIQPTSPMQNYTHAKDKEKIRMKEKKKEEITQEFSIILKKEMKKAS